MELEEMKKPPPLNSTCGHSRRRRWWTGIMFVAEKNRRTCKKSDLCDLDKKWRKHNSWRSSLWPRPVACGIVGQETSPHYWFVFVGFSCSHLVPAPRRFVMIDRHPSLWGILVGLCWVVCIDWSCCCARRSLIVDLVVSTATHLEDCPEDWKLSVVLIDCSDCWEKKIERWREIWEVTVRNLMVEIGNA